MKHLSDPERLSGGPEMESRQFGSLLRHVAEIGQGSWNIEDEPVTTAVEAMRRGIDLGLTHIDTAEMYGSGKAERLIAKAIQGRRNDVFLVSKVLPSNGSRKGVVQACEASLARLNTDRLDCYLLHWRGSHPLRETVAAFDQLIRDGKNTVMGREQFRCGRSRRGLRHPGLESAGLQSGPLPSGRKSH